MNDRKKPYRSDSSSQNRSSYGERNERGDRGRGNRNRRDDSRGRDNSGLRGRRPRVKANIDAHVISAEDAGMNVEKWFARHYDSKMGSDKIDFFASRDAIRVDGESSGASRVLRAGQKLSFPSHILEEREGGYESRGERSSERSDRFERRDSSRSGSRDNRREGRSDSFRSERRGGRDFRRDDERGENNEERRSFSRSGGERRFSNRKDSDNERRGGRYGARDGRSRDRRDGRDGRGAQHREGGDPKDSPKYALLAKKAESWIICRDEHIIAINKPSGLATQGGSGINVSLDELARDVFAFRKVEPKLVHRLDIGTSGVIIMARSDEAVRELGAAFQSREMTKKYVAILCGRPEQDSGTISYPLIKKSSGADKERIQHDAEDGKEAVTHYKVLKSNGRFSLVEFSIDTGRTHQIRVHSSMIGCPILGDRKYGDKKLFSRDDKNHKFLHLHAMSIAFKMFDRNYQIAAPMPWYMENIVGQIESSEADVNSDEHNKHDRVENNAADDASNIESCSQGADLDSNVEHCAIDSSECDRDANS